MSNRDICPQEYLALAADGASMSEAMSRHLELCSSCREARLLAAGMRLIATRHIATPPPDPEVIWILAQLSKPRPLWTSETISGIATLMAAALLAVWIWPAIAGYLTGLLPKSSMMLNMFLTSCVAAGTIAGVAAKTIRRWTGE